MRFNKIIIIILTLLFVPIVYGALTQVINSPANLYQSTSSSVLFNWTPTSTLNTSINSTLYIDGVSNTSIICTNATSCNITKSLSVGFHNWTVYSSDAVSTSTSTNRWLEIRTYNESILFRWGNSTDGSYVMTLDSNTGDLNITGGIKARGTSRFEAPVYFESNVTIITPQSLYINQTLNLRDLTDTTKIFLNASGISYFNAGNVGIGTTTPAGKLHIYQGASGVSPIAQIDDLVIEGGAAALGISLLSNSSGGGETQQIAFGDTGAANQGLISFNHATNAMGFGTNSAATNMIIDSSGKIGIGTTTPGAKLHVIGEVNISGISGDGTGKAVCIKANGDLGTCSDAVGAGGTCTCA